MKTGMIKALAVAASVLTAGSAQAITLNLDAGWDKFNFGAVGTFAQRTFSFTLTGHALLTLVDGYTSGDRFELFANGISRGLTTSPTEGFKLGNKFDQALADPNFSSRSYKFGPGTYTISILVDDRAGTDTLRHLGAIRLDTAPVPVPAAGLMLMGGLGGLAALRKRRKA